MHTRSEPDKSGHPSVRRIDGAGAFGVGAMSHSFYMILRFRSTVGPADLAQAKGEVS